jgi:hypothetical protein
VQQLRYADVRGNTALGLPRPNRICFTSILFFGISLRFNIGYGFPIIGYGGKYFGLNGSNSKLEDSVYCSVSLIKQYSSVQNKNNKIGGMWQE